MRVFRVRLEPHQVDDVDDADPEVGQVLAEDRGRRQRLEGRDVAAAGENDVGIIPRRRLKPTPRCPRRACNG